MSEPQRLAEQLSCWLKSQGREVEVVVTHQATVGLSQVTWFVNLIDGPESTDAVLRLPTESSGAASITRQHTCLEAVAGVIPAPRALWFADSADNPLGSPFLIMERIHGVVPVRWDDIEEPRRSTLAAAAVDVLARLHSIDPARFATAADRPAGAGTGAGGTHATELARYRRRIHKLGKVPAVLQAGLWWLERHRPATRGVDRPVHGDFRMGNLIVDGDEITGVLDWEMAGRGDRMLDLAWCFIPVWSLPGIDEEPLLERYADRSGVPLDRELFQWYRVLSYVRLAYYALSGSKAFSTGASQDLRLAALRLQLPVHLDRLASALSGRVVV